MKNILESIILGGEGGGARYVTLVKKVNIACRNKKQIRGGAGGGRVRETKCAKRVLGAHFLLAGPLLANFSRDFFCLVSSSSLRRQKKKNNTRAISFPFWSLGKLLLTRIKVKK